MGSHRRSANGRKAPLLPAGERLAKKLIESRAKGEWRRDLVVRAFLDRIVRNGELDRPIKVDGKAVSEEEHEDALGFIKGHKRAEAVSADG